MCNALSHTEAIFGLEGLIMYTLVTDWVTTPQHMEKWNGVGYYMLVHIKHVPIIVCINTICSNEICIIQLMRISCFA